MLKDNVFAVNRPNSVVDTPNLLNRPTTLRCLLRTNQNLLCYVFSGGDEVGGLNSRWVEQSCRFFLQPIRVFLLMIWRAMCFNTYMYVINSNVLSMDVKYISQKLNILWEKELIDQNVQSEAHILLKTLSPFCKYWTVSVWCF